MLYFFYNILLLCAAVLLLPYYSVIIILTGKYKKSIGSKFGFIPFSMLRHKNGSPRIWIHAVSVGEVTAAVPVISKLKLIYPNAYIVFSTSTETGQEMARRMAPMASTHIYYPLDIPWVIKKVLAIVKPDIFIPVETEIWPNMIQYCHKFGIPVVMINGRVSPRSYVRYRKTRFFWKHILQHIDAFGVISDTDADRIVALGADRARVRVIGNAKYDSLASQANISLQKEVAATLNIPENALVFVAGSTHKPEESIVLKVYQSLTLYFQDLYLIIVPRHVERKEEILSLIKEKGFRDIITMTEIKRGKQRTTEKIILIDVIGELFKIYSLGTVVFCGGSLVERGGQNILEPAAWGKVVFYGPSMEDFMEEREALERAGAGITVKDDKELFENIHFIMSNPKKLIERGKIGMQTVDSNRGASERYVLLIRQYLNQRELKAS